MIIELYRQFSRSIAWNALESISYQLLLLCHQIALFKMSSSATYGLIGSLFSLTSLIVTITNFGLDITLSPFYKLLTQSKQKFRTILIQQLLLEYALLGVLIISGLIAKSLLPQSWGIHQLTINMILLLILLICFEGAKKTLRMLLQLGFLNHTTAIVEIITIISYISLVWLGYFIGFPITLELVFIPMLLVSIVSTLILSLYVYSYYKSLPNHSSLDIPSDLGGRIFRSRFFNFLNQISHMVFSSNFLVPFFALQFGLAQAGLLKLVSAITHCITVILQKVFGLSSSLLLSHLKNDDLATKQHAFLTITNRLNQVLYGIIIFLIFNFETLLNLSSFSGSNLTFTLAYLFLIISFSENFFIAYEKFYIAEEKAEHLFFFNLLVMGALGTIIWFSIYFSQMTILLSIIAIRICAFSCISIISLYRWNIKPALKIQPLYFAWSFHYFNCILYNNSIKV